MSRYSFSVVGYQTWDGRKVQLDEPIPAHRVTAVPGVAPSDIHRTLVFAYDTQNRDDNHYFWANSLQEFETWEGWIDYITRLMDSYGMVDS